MFAVEIFLPLHDNEGNSFPKQAFDAVRDQLSNEFGGVTAYVRAPAEGLWEDDRGTLKRDEIVIFEVVVERIDMEWWANYRRQLQATFAQEELLIRATEMQRL